MDKKDLRNEILRSRTQLTKEEIEKFSKLIEDRLYEMDYYKKANRIMSFVSAASEVHTHQLIKRSISIGKSMLVPFTIHEPREMKASELFDFSELEVGYHNILAPKKEFHRFVEPSTIDLILVPGLAFAKNGYRVGYGGGYYDRFLSKIDKGVIKIGLAFDLQIVDQVPVDDFDIPVDLIITEERTIYCK
ncbi:MAG: 5-formyltetrahydrofolate cyclo-ligase [Tissierellaceae bacterium]